MGKHGIDFIQAQGKDTNLQRYFNQKNSTTLYFPEKTYFITNEHLKVQADFENPK